MRVIGGSAKGRQLKSPAGLPTRPTSDRVREAIFNMLESMPGVDWDRVLDLYAGTGALGIEALSRGAHHADFVENNPAACAIIRENLRRTNLADRGRVYCLPVRQALNTLTGLYGIILLDPPYGDPTLPDTLARLGESALIGPNTVMVVEHAKRDLLADEYGRFHVVKRRRHGDTVVSIYRTEAGESA